MKGSEFFEMIVQVSLLLHSMRPVARVSSSDFPVGRADLAQLSNTLDIADSRAALAETLIGVARRSGRGSYIRFRRIAIAVSCVML